MRCKTCDYPLWNLPARKCPECGTDFKPSDFHFVPNSVRFCCPHCEQQYFGTTPEGHLIPRAFSCVKCGQRVDMDEMLLQPAEGVEESRTAADVMPWLERQRRGWVRGLLGTITRSMVSPQRLMKATPPTASNAEAWSFGIVTNFLVTLGGAVLPLLCIAAIMLINRDPDAVDMLGGAGVFLIIGTIGAIITIAVWGLLTHALLKITGGTAHGIGRTYQALLYSSGANALLAIPCLGPYCAGYFCWIWWMVSAILMVMEGQNVRGLRATLCVGAPPIALVLAVILGYVGLIFFAIRQGAMQSGMMNVSGSGYVALPEAMTVGGVLTGYASSHNGQGPTHALELVADGTMPAASFAIWQIGHDEANVPVGDTTLDAFQYLPPNRMRLKAGEVAAKQPANVVAHRLGDVVMTYHGIDLRTADPQLWIAVVCPDPDQATPLNGVATQPARAPPSRAGGMPAMPMGNMVAVRVDGTPMILQTAYMQDLAAQNALRAASGLPPLPDPNTIRNTAPATSP